METEQHSMTEHDAASRMPGRGADLLRRAVHLPTPMLEDMRKQARRLEQSVSWCVHTAWTLASADVQTWSQHDRAAEHRLLGGRRRPEPMVLPEGIWQQLTAESARLDRSPSWLVQQAWLAARPALLRAAKR
jgi:uncharacterized small protein (TIGR04563 family)